MISFPSGFNLNQLFTDLFTIGGWFVPVLLMVTGFMIIRKVLGSI